MQHPKGGICAQEVISVFLQNALQLTYGKTLLKNMDRPRGLALEELNQAIEEIYALSYYEYAMRVQVNHILHTSYMRAGAE